MRAGLTDLLHLLELERIEDNIFRGESRIGTRSGPCRSRCRTSFARSPNAGGPGPAPTCSIAQCHGLVAHGGGNSSVGPLP